MDFWVSKSAEETMELGRLLGRELPLNSIVAFFGDLGAGKTTFIKGLVSAAASCDPNIVQSPTFTYLNIYEGAKTVYHFDLYRLDNIDQFLSMGFDEYFEAYGLCCIEWAERITEFLPRSSVKITFEHLENSKRRIIVD